MTANLSHLEALLAAATPGPWERDLPDFPGDVVSKAPRWHTVVGKRGYTHDADADLIVALVNAAPALLAIARAAEAWRDAEEHLVPIQCGCVGADIHDTTNTAQCALACAEWDRDQAAEQLRAALAALDGAK